MKTSKGVTMKRYGNIFEKIVSMENLRLAHINARKDKHFYREVKMVDANPDYYLKKIQKMLIEHTYEVSEYSISTINDNGKERELMKLPYFPDRIIQWAIMLQIEPIFMKTFCNHTCASIKDRGIKKATQLIDKCLKKKNKSKYCLKIDVSKFYPNINHAILKKLLRKKFKDKELLDLLDLIIDSYPGNKGVPIGSYLSQFLANFYLTYFDHWLKENEKFESVVRYMDDVVIFHESKEFLQNLLRKMKIYLKEKLDLLIKSNYQVFPVYARGVDFVGYRTFFEYRLLRKKTCNKFKKRMLEIKAKQDQGKLINYNEWCSANSYVGWLKWCDSWRLFEKYIEPVIYSLSRYYFDVIIKDKEPETKVICLEKYKEKLFKKKGRCAA